MEAELLSKKWTIIGVVICLLAFTAAAMAYSPLKRLWYSYLNGYATEHYVQQMMAFNARKDRNIPNHSVLFYGDSLVQGLSVTAASPMAVNYGIGHAGSAEILSQLESHHNLDRAAAVIMAFGINDIARGNPEVVSSAYRKSLELIPSSIPVIISLIMPVDEENLGRTGISDTVTSVNQSLDVLCSENKRVLCVNAGQLLMESGDQLSDQYHVGDGLHLNARGNAVWLEQLGIAVDQATQKADADNVQTPPR
ncbi:SGNH/GDSL hydrolase family protein [Marinobacter sp. OP 3.4]|uniref:SGNH/GDSL hydrolase family protein n=1 Tax=Marinobacter sp. OP 3.4 TaxID=3076501 RepID=UPI002E22D077